MADRPNIRDLILEKTVPILNQSIEDLDNTLLELRNDPEVTSEEYQLVEQQISKMRNDLYRQTVESAELVATPIEGEFEKTYEMIDLMGDKLDTTITDVNLLKRQVASLIRGLPVPQEGDEPPTLPPGIPPSTLEPTTSNGIPLPDPWRGTPEQFSITAQYAAERVSSGSGPRVALTYAAQLAEAAIPYISDAVRAGATRIIGPITTLPLGGIQTQTPFERNITKVANLALEYGRNNGLF